MSKCAHGIFVDFRRGMIQKIYVCAKLEWQIVSMITHRIKQGFRHLFGQLGIGCHGSKYI